jgi:hypothetical protein
MSEVTNVLLAFSILEDEADRLRDINEWLAAHDHGAFVATWRQDACIGGPKRLEAPLLAGAFNYFPLADFLELLRGIEWNEPDVVQLIVRAPHESRWQLIDA